MKKPTTHQRKVTDLIVAALFWGAVTAVDYYSTVFRYQLLLVNPAYFVSLWNLPVTGDWLSMQFSPVILGMTFSLFFGIVPLGAYLFSKRYFDAGDRKTGLLYFLTIVLPISIFGVEDVLWFRVFGETMPLRLEWLDYSLTGLVGQVLGYGGASATSLIIVSSIGIAIVTFMWYYRLKNPLLFVNLALFVLFAVGVVPYFMLFLMGVVILIILLKPNYRIEMSSKRWTRSVQTAK